MAKYNFTYKPGTVTEDKDITLTLNTSYNGVAVNKKEVTIKVKAAAANYTVNGSTTTNSVTLDKNNRSATVDVTNGGGYSITADTDEDSTVTNKLATFTVSGNTVTVNGNRYNRTGSANIKLTLTNSTTNSSSTISIPLTVNGSLYKYSCPTCGWSADEQYKDEGEDTSDDVVLTVEPNSLGTSLMCIKCNDDFVIPDLITTNY